MEKDEGPDRPVGRGPPTAARQTMRGIRRWLSSAALLSGTTALAQSPEMSPVLTDEPAIATALPGGTVVGSHAAPAGSVSTVPIAATPESMPPAAAAPLTAPPPAPIPGPSPGA